VCGNASTTQITISAISFPPVTELAASCNSTKLTFGRSAYYQYRWKAPNGITYTADTLTIQPVTAADTGVYTIERAADINGCRDTAISTYHLLLKNVYEQTVSICPGHSISVGAHTYSAAGIFRDTLKSALLCDSIVVTHLTLLPLKRDTVSHIMCPGQQFLFNGHIYQAAGVYSDTLPGSICDSIVTLVLSVNLKRDSVVQTICAGSSWNFNGRLLTAPGIYRDTLPTATCDSIVILNLSVLPLKRDTVHESICAGETWLFNGKSLTAAGGYTDTLPTAGCDSIVVLYLQVTTAEVHITTAPQTIVTGASVQLEATDAKSYAWTGTGVVFNNAGIFNPVATPAASGWIMVHATSDPDGCPVTDSVFITVLDKATYCEDAYIYVPTAFTPNGDGRNDVFRIVAQKVTLKSFQIYNRWGERVFATSDIGTAWNGRHRGGLLPGSYVYMISYTDCMGVLKMLKGTVTLLL
jgi:gliding motility-associated-like protein